MALTVQYNKTFLQQLSRGLRVRENALPTLVAKESALRLEVKKARENIRNLQQQLKQKTAALTASYPLWPEFPADLVAVSRVDLEFKKIAGVKALAVKEVVFSLAPYSMFAGESWIPAGIEIVKNLVRLSIDITAAQKTVTILEYARKKTTQKVNLYEKVQIPAYQEAILKIKRFMEDEENLSKSSQKILKAKIAALELPAAKQAA